MVEEKVERKVDDNIKFQVIDNKRQRTLNEYQRFS